MKKVIALLMTLVMMLCLVACGGENNTSGTNKTQSSVHDSISGDESPSGESAAGCGEAKHNP